MSGGLDCRILGSMKTLPLVLLLTLLCACFTGSGRLETKSFALANFDSIEIDRGIELDVTRGDPFAVSITADDNLWDVLKVSQDGTTLHIELPSDRIFSDVTVHATVSMPVLASVHASGGSHATLSGFDVAVPNLSLHASGGSTIEGDASADTLSLHASGGSHATLFGAVQTANVSLSGGSNASIEVDRNLDYDLSGGSHLVYSGNPQIGKSDTSGGSSAERK
jgi:hypothetical protein